MADTLASRYGRTTRGGGVFKRPLLVALGVVIVVLIAGAAFLAFRPNTAPHTPESVSMTVHDSASVSLNFSIVPDHTRAIRCFAVVRNQFEAVVGYKEVLVAAQDTGSPAQPINQSVTVKTTQRGAQGRLEECAFIG